MSITLPFPPSSLSGHNKGHWRDDAAIVRKHRQWARAATLAARPSIPAEGDIIVSVTFVPPDRRGDRVNFANRMKPYFDGIAAALGVNDARFLPRYHFAQPEKPGRVEVRLGQHLTPPAIPPDLSPQDYIDAVKLADSPAEYKARLMLCREMGILSDADAEDWIAMAGVQHD